MRPCLDCGTLTKGSRCPLHSAAAQRARDAKRGTPAERGYGADWRRLRLLVLERDGYLCGWCGDPANTVDHVVPLALGGARLDPENLVAACRSCNGRKDGGTRRPPQRRTGPYGGVS